MVVHVTMRVNRCVGAVLVIKSMVVIISWNKCWSWSRSSVIEILHWGGNDVVVVSNRRRNDHWRGDVSRGGCGCRWWWWRVNSSVIVSVVQIEVVQMESVSAGCWEGIHDRLSHCFRHVGSHSGEVIVQRSYWSHWMRSWNRPVVTVVVVVGESCFMVVVSVCTRQQWAQNNYLLGKYRGIILTERSFGGYKEVELVKEVVTNLLSTHMKILEKSKFGNFENWKIENFEILELL